MISHLTSCYPEVSLVLWLFVTSLTAEADQDGCQLVKVAAEDRQNSRCFNEPECEDVCDMVDTEVCSIIHRKECSPVTKQHCTTSDSPVCTTVYEEVCSTSPRQECHTGLTSHP